LMSALQPISLLSVRKRSSSATDLSLSGVMLSRLVADGAPKNFGVGLLV
jgi:hypothetical protein